MLRRLLPLSVLALCFAVPAGAADPKDEAVKKELKAFEGAWDGKSRLSDGKEEPAPPGGAQLIFSGEKYTIKLGGKVTETGTFSIDPSKKPKTIDLTPTEGGEKGKKEQGIYELTGDDLKIAVAFGSSERPTDFSGKKSEVYTFKRAKP
jgi:uncharacterized protein (TIGR03067 family)